MAPFLATLFKLSRETFTVTESNQSLVTVKDQSGVQYAVPRSIVVGSVSVGDQVVLGMYAKPDFDQAMLKSAKQLLNEMLHED